MVALIPVTREFTYFVSKTYPFNLSTLVSLNLPILVFFFCFFPGTIREKNTTITPQNGVNVATLFLVAPLKTHFSSQWDKERLGCFLGNGSIIVSSRSWK